MPRFFSQLWFGRANLARLVGGGVKAPTWHGSIALIATLGLGGCRTAVPVSDETQESGDDDDDNDDNASDDESATSEEEDGSSTSADDTDASTTEQTSTSEEGSESSEMSDDGTQTSDESDEGTTSGADSSTETTMDTTSDSTTDSNGGDPCAGDHPVVRIETNMGTMDVTLDRVHAPNTVANFLSYVEMGIYDGLIFHRIIDDFMIQGGGFRPGMEPIETMPPIDLEISQELRHVDGAISMARTDDLNSATSQFFICDGVQAFLDDNYAAFGVLTAGIEVLRDLAAVPTTSDVPNDDVVMTKVSCI